MRHAELNERQSVKGTGARSASKLDSAVVGVAVEAFGANAKPYAHISALWVFGANTSITEESPYNAPAMVAWKEAIDHRILGEPGIRGILIISGTAYGDGGGGIPGILLGSPRDADGNLIMLGAGGQHWATVHVADLAAVFRSALENDGARGRYVIGNGLTPTVSELTEAAAVAVGAPGAIPGSDQEGAFAARRLFRRGTSARPGNESGQGPCAAGLATHSPRTR